MPSTAPANEAPLAILCGGGSLPYTVAQSVMKSGREVLLFGLRGFADPARVELFPHVWMGLGQFGVFKRHARARGCRDVVFVGSTVRPSLRQLGLDLAALRHIPQLVGAFRGGDDHLLRGVGGIFEQNGFRLIGAHEAAPDILVPAGALGRREPTARERSDITRALGLLRAMGPFDVGQAAVISDGHVLAVEAAEGTDRMLERIADLRKAGRIAAARGGILVKAPKPGQDRRLDLPAIGPASVSGVAQAGLAGLAVAAGATIVADAQDVVRLADEAQVFVYGIPANEAGAA